ncbi:cytosine deaminase [Leptothoe kymatousa]|uniref:Cytosine deaminase n=1 Tax=Leptothoe kymatousa TAU-MAC 1615 TaxID=2364775 RepID=A0ABS5Y709_9CYAN|nr:cytosine deaminase [Leptothoe kymatousa]MBT9313612.1 cytosine deaminase [Leptothoe kymatousa TAU-MAC 1615]
MNPTLILRNGTLNHVRLDIAIEGDTITAIEPRLDLTAPTEIDITGKLISPPFVESHIHLDSALTAGQPRHNQSGTLFEGIEIWRERKQTLTQADIKQRAIEALKLMASQGTLFVRTHVDVSETSLTALEGLLEVREAVKDWLTLQIVAFPQDGIYGSPPKEGPKNNELIEEAIILGADVVGGIPHYELTRDDGIRSIYRIFELAEKYNRLIDIHCDEIDDDQSRFLEVVSACALRSGLKERVTASHTTAFGSYNNAYALKLIGFLKQSRVNFIANPLINITLQGRTDTYPKRRGLTRVKELWQAGLNVSLGNDCIQDPWYSLGTGNMLDAAAMAVHVCQMTGLEELEACYDMATTHGACTLNLKDDYGVDVGKPANLIVLDCPSKEEAIRLRPTVSHVIARGKVLVETTAPQVKWRQNVG